jgi:hypothetical protein
MTWDVGTIVKDVSTHESRAFSSQDNYYVVVLSHSGSQIKQEDPPNLSI